MWLIPAILAAALAVVLVALLLLLPPYVMTGKRQTLAEAFQWQTEHYDTSFYDGLEKVDYTVQGAEGYLLHAELLKNPGGGTKYVIISHGYTDNRIGSLKYVTAYLELGYHCIIYDLRGHGEYAPTFTTYGILEGEDLNCLIRDTRERFPELTVLGLHGESLGAATSVTVLKYRPDADFVAADCGFSDIENVLKNGLRNARLPAFLFSLADLGARLRYRYSLRDMRPIDSLAGSEVPILFIHGGEDSFVLPKNSEDMADRTQGYHELHIIPGAGHAESVLKDPQAYEECLSGFLRSLGCV